MGRISIKIGDLEVFADTTEENPGTVKAILENLPVRGEAQRWGEEIYFFVPFDIAREANKSLRQECEPGEIGFWPENPALAIFFGKTPVSEGDKPKAYSPCAFFARLQEPFDKVALNAVKNGLEIIVSKAE